MLEALTQQYKHQRWPQTLQQRHSSQSTFFSHLNKSRPTHFNALVYCPNMEYDIRLHSGFSSWRAQGMDEIWLTTDKDVNVTIYKKLGFQVMTEKVISSSGVKSWTMKYV
ncbi:unnamed protein product [Aphanomyces euteiches]|nr:hypothetical protein Ae201684P_002823 [Aphanomyces euteiches]